MNQNIEDTKKYFSEFSSLKNDDNSYLFFPPNYLLSYFSQNLSDINWGMQNCYFENSGAFTGENSPKTLKEMGAKYSLVGHSERRHVFGESDEWVNKKTLKLLENKITPVICVGETLEQRKSGETQAVIKEQIIRSLKNVNESSDLLLAYEPVWAIGTGEVASVQQVAEVHVFIKNLLVEIYSKEKSEKTPVLYGGSVKPENSEELYSIFEVDGFLVGGASLKPDSFSKI